MRERFVLGIPWGGAAAVAFGLGAHACAPRPGRRRHRPEGLVDPAAACSAHAWTEPRGERGAARSGVLAPVTTGVRGRLGPPVALWRAGGTRGRDIAGLVRRLAIDASGAGARRLPRRPSERVRPGGRRPTVARGRSRPLDPIV